MVLSVQARAVVNDLPFRTVGVGAAQYGPHILKAQPVTMQDGGIDVHPHCWQGSPPDEDPSHTLYLRQFLLQDGGSHVVQAGSANNVT